MAKKMKDSDAEEELIEAFKASSDRGSRNRLGLQMCVPPDNFGQLGQVCRAALPWHLGAGVLALAKTALEQCSRARCMSHQRRGHVWPMGEIAKYA